MSILIACAAMYVAGFWVGWFHGRHKLREEADRAIEAGEKMLGRVACPRCLGEGMVLNVRPVTHPERGEATLGG